MFMVILWSALWEYSRGEPALLYSANVGLVVRLNVFSGLNPGWHFGQFNCKRRGGNRHMECAKHSQRLSRVLVCDRGLDMSVEVSANQCWGGSQSGWKGHLIRHLRYAIVCIQEGRRFNSWDPCLHCWKVWRRNSHPPRNSRFTMPVLKINGLSVCSDGAGCSRKTAPPLNAMGLQIQSRFKTKQLPIESCLRTCRNTPAVWVSSTRKTENQLNQLGFHRDDLFEANAHGHKSVSNLPFTKPGVSMCFLRCHWGTSPHRLATKPEATAKNCIPEGYCTWVPKDAVDPFVSFLRGCSKHRSILIF